MEDSFDRKGYDGGNLPLSGNDHNCVASHPAVQFKHKPERLAARSSELCNVIYTFDFFAILLYIFTSLTVDYYLYSYQFNQIINCYNSAIKIGENIFFYNKSFFPNICRKHLIYEIYLMCISYIFQAEEKIKTQPWSSIKITPEIKPLLLFRLIRCWVPGAELIITCFCMIHFLKKKTVFFSLLLLPVQLQESARGSRTGHYRS